MDNTLNNIISKLYSANPSNEDILYLIEHINETNFSKLFELSNKITKKRFGNTIKLYAPLYLSNYCDNDCPYCSFGKSNNLNRKALTIDEALNEAEVLINSGQRHILLVSGEDDKNVSIDYLEQISRLLRPKIAQLIIEIKPLNYELYKRLHSAGVDGVTLYQETYNKELYTKYHSKCNSKSDYDSRLASMNDAGKSGMRFLGIGALFGLNKWKEEFLALLEHAKYLSNKFWNSHISISFPRIQPNQSNFKPPYSISDFELAKMIAITRIARPDDDLILSTRESAKLRSKLIPIGITRISAGSKTSPGAYSLNNNDGTQFEISDKRSSIEVANELSKDGYDIVWKDWI